MASNGFKYLKTRGRPNVLIMNTTNRPVPISRVTVVAEYVPTTPYEYCQKGEGTQIDVSTLTNHKEVDSLNYMEVDKMEDSMEPTGSSIHTNSEDQDPEFIDYIRRRLSKYKTSFPN